MQPPCRYVKRGCGHRLARNRCWRVVRRLTGPAGLQVARPPTKWPGTLTSLPWPNWHGPEVNHRSFPAFTGFIACLGVGALSALLAELFDVETLSVATVLTFRLGVLTVLPLWILVSAVNRSGLAVNERAVG